jgi:transposase-like protein
VSRKKKINKYPAGFRKLALERMKTCRNVSELSAELGIHRTQLYKWRRAMEATDDGYDPPANSGERELRKQVRELKRVLGEKVLKADLFVYLAVILDAHSRKVARSDARYAITSGGTRTSDRGAATATWLGAPLRPRRAVRFWRLREDVEEAPVDPQHEPAGEPLRQCQL